MEKYFYVALAATLYVTLVGGCWFCIPRPSDALYSSRMPRGKVFPAVLLLVTSLLVTALVLLVQFERGRAALLPLSARGALTSKSLLAEALLQPLPRPTAHAAAHAASTGGARSSGASAAAGANASAGAAGIGVHGHALGARARDEPLVLAFVGMLATAMAFVLVAALWVRGRRHGAANRRGGRGERKLRYERRRDYSIPYTNMTPEKQQLRMVDDVWERYAYHTFSANQVPHFGSPYRNPDRSDRGDRSDSFSGSESDGGDRGPSAGIERLPPRGGREQRALLLSHESESDDGHEMEL